MPLSSKICPVFPSIHFEKKSAIKTGINVKANFPNKKKEYLLQQRQVSFEV